MKSHLLFALFLAFCMTTAAHAQCRVGSGPEFGDGIPYCSDLQAQDDPVEPRSPQIDVAPLQLPSLWGAIAIDPQSAAGGVGVSSGMPSRRVAEITALRQCRETGGGPTCRVEVSYGNQCAALAWGDHYYHTAYGPSVDEASEIALRGCSRRTENCKIYYSNCT